MKIRYRRTHTVRPENYESAGLVAEIEIDSDNEEDAEFFGGDKPLSSKQIGAILSEELDDLLETDVDRILRLEGQHVDTMHLWKFYGRD